MWSSTVGLVNGKHRYLTAETFGFKINSNGQVMKKRQQWTIEPFPENSGPDSSISSAASVSSQCQINTFGVNNQLQQQQQYPLQQTQPSDPNDPCILTFSSGGVGSSLTSIKSSSNGSSASDQDGCGEEHENVAIKSHLNKYLAVDSFGNVTCDSDEKSENARFTITICSMSQGRSKDEHIFWAFRNVERGYYLGTTDDGMICCNAKMPKSRSELWHLHLIPARGASFFALKSLGRKRFARVVDSDDKSEQYTTKYQQDQNNNKSQVQLDATISWGPETLFQFKYYEGGRYSLLTKDCMYLTNEGKCINWKSPDNSDSSLPPPDCLFTLEYHSGFLAFRDSFSQYLAAAGRSSILRSRSIGVSRDELFVFENAPIQISLKATFNNRWVSIKQGVDISANQTEATNKFETFQLTYHKQTQSWSIMTQECNFWTVLHNTNTVSVCKPGDYEGLTRGQFRLVWNDADATCSLKFVDANRQERWISARKSGQLFLASGNQVQVKFIMRFQNRRLLNLRPVDGSGFVGLKGTNCKQLEANKTSPDSIAIEYSELPSSHPGVLFPEVQSIRGCCPIQSSKCAGDDSSSTVSDQSTINIFNVKLNSTKMGQSFLDRFNSSSNGNDSLKKQHEMERQQGHEQVIINSETSRGKQFVEFGIDDNNNNTDEYIDKLSGGSVEISSTPSVASIINSFSNTRLKDKEGTTTINTTNDQLSNHRLQSNQLTKPDRVNSSVLKLASTFNAATTTTPTISPATTNGANHQNEATSDTASVITSCSTASASSSVISGGSINNTEQSHQISSPQGTRKDSSFSSNDPLSQLECCYLKILSNNKYLVVGNNDSSIICDATNKACAQPWILELRSHNSIAIRASDNHAYMQLGTNGTVFLSRCDPKDASLWEF